MNIFNEIKWFFQRAKRGWDDTATWELDEFLSTQIADTIEHLKNTRAGIPAKMFEGFQPSETGAYTKEETKIAEERWNSILGEIITGFRAYKEKKYYCCVPLPQDFERAFFLFHEYFQNLWN